MNTLLKTIQAAVSNFALISLYNMQMRPDHSLAAIIGKIVGEDQTWTEWLLQKDILLQNKINMHHRLM